VELQAVRKATELALAIKTMPFSSVRRETGDMLGCLCIAKIEEKLI
jgi:hypothetical protein